MKELKVILFFTVAWPGFALVAIWAVSLFL
jgi:hypothetical protein